MAVTVKGARSPDWALWDRMEIATRSGVVYLRRLRIVQTPWFSVMVHDILSPDPDLDPHDHPWEFISVILRGGYDEAVWPPALAGPGFRWHHSGRMRYWRRWSAHRMRKESLHQITRVEPGTRTLVLTGRRSRSWGFQTNDGWVDWREYEDIHTRPCPLKIAGCDLWTDDGEVDLHYWPGESDPCKICGDEHDHYGHRHSEVQG